MRYELSDDEWSAIKPMLPNKPRGVRRVNDRRVLNGIFGSSPRRDRNYGDSALNDARAFAGTPNRAPLKPGKWPKPFRLESR
jgi:transposase